MNRILPTIAATIRNASISLVISFFLFLSHGVFAQFEGDFEPANWGFTSENSDASVNLSQIPNAITITGGNDRIEGNTDYIITVNQSGDIKFSWTFFTTDAGGAEFDQAGYLLNDVFIQLTDISGPPSQNGTISVTVANGDVFGFRVHTDDGIEGPGLLTIENFTPFKNTAPTLDNIEDVFVGINQAPFTVDLAGISAGIDEPTQTISVSATSGDPAILPNPVVTYTSPDATGSLLLSPVADAFGTAIITVTVSDDGGNANGGIDNIVKTFMIDINSNFPPQIDALSNLTLPINNSEQAINLTGISAGKNSDESQIITIAASSSNQALVNASNIFIDYLSPADNGTLRFTPTAGVTGQTTIMLTLMDDGGTANNGNDTFTISFVVKINANQSPTIDSIDDLSLPVNASQQMIFFSGVNDGDGRTQNIVVSATSDNPGLIPNPELTYTSPNANGLMSFTPVADQFGVANITMTVQDNGGTQNGGIDVVTTSFSVEVSSNFTPTLDPLGDLVLPVNNGSQIVNLTGISAGLGETQTLSVSAVSDNTGLIPDPTVTYTPSNTSGTIEFTPVADMNGTANITVTVQDDGGTGNGGTDIFSQSFIVQVATNLPPTIDPLDDLTILKNSGEQTINLSGIGAGVGETQNLSIGVLSDNQALVPDFTLNYTPNDPTGSFSFTTAPDQTGIANISVTVSDDGGTDNNGIDTTVETFVLRVNNSVSYSASTTGALNFERPLEGTPPSSTSAGDFPYHVQPFTVTETGVYNISISTANYDPFLAIYENGFNPADSRINALSANDDDDIGDLGILSFLGQQLVAGTQYFAVTTSSLADQSGDFTAQIVGQGDISLGTQPTLDFIADVVIDEEGSTTINLSGITDGLGSTQSLVVTAAANDGNIFSDIMVTHDDGAGTGSFPLPSLPDANGEAIITVTVSGDNIEFKRNFTVTVNPINDTPDFTLDQTAATANQDFINEIMINVIPGAVPADETNQLVIYSVAPSISALASVQIDPNTGVVSINAMAGAFGNETFTVTADDQESENNIATQVFTLSINALPTDITLSNDLIEEDVPVGTTVGTLTTTDPDDTDGFIYSLVTGDGDDNNADFTIDNGVLKTSSAFDVSQLIELSIRIRTEDDGGAGFEKVFAISVDDITGIDDEFLSQFTKIWPNPGTGKFHVSIEMPVLVALDIFVTDLSGRVIKHHYISPVSTKVDTDLELYDIQTGLYLLSIKTGDGRKITKRIIKE